MTVILPDLYVALRSAGAGEELARAAAAEVAGSDHLERISADMKVIRWMAMVSVALTVAALAKLLI